MFLVGLLAPSPSGLNRILQGGNSTTSDTHSWQQANLKIQAQHQQ
jgi:hypothetical protein